MTAHSFCLSRLDGVGVFIGNALSQVPYFLVLSRNDVFKPSAVWTCLCLGYRPFFCPAPVITVELTWINLSSFRVEVQ